MSVQRQGTGFGRVAGRNLRAHFTPRVDSVSDPRALLGVVEPPKGPRWTPLSQRWLARLQESFA
jgi:hypothetical protein